LVDSPADDLLQSDELLVDPDEPPALLGPLDERAAMQQGLP
jgi:hypothetical protein